MPRAACPGYAYHITQRGSGGRPIFREDRDRFVYLTLLRKAGRQHGLSFDGYCLMPDHVHLIAAPRQADSLHRGLRWAHSTYARYFHARYGGRGRLWQPRLFHCALDAPARWRALAYIETNPLRTGAVRSPEDHPWSSGCAHLGLGRPYLPLRTEEFGQNWDAESWREALKKMLADYDFWKGLRQSTQTGRPLAPAETLIHLEDEWGRSGSPAIRGLKARAAAAGQSEPAPRQDRLRFGD